MPEPMAAELSAWAVRAVSVRVPPGERRNPIAMVRIAVGPLVMVLGVSRLKKSDLMVRSPMSKAGIPAISATPELWAVIERAAVKAVAADPVAREYVLGKVLKRMSKLPVAPRPTLATGTA